MKSIKDTMRKIFEGSIAPKDINRYDRTILPSQGPIMCRSNVMVIIQPKDK